MVDYSEGIFDKIISINFGGGQWFVVYALGFTDSPNAVDVDFPDMSGGTPGFSLLTAAATIAIKTLGPTSKVKLDQNLKTKAGAAVTGFAISRFNLFPNSVEVALLLRLDDHFPKSIFRMKSGPKLPAEEQNSTFGVIAVTKNLMKGNSTISFKPGTTAGLLIDGKAANVDGATGIAELNPGAADISLDPTVPKLIVARSGVGGGGPG